MSLSGKRVVAALNAQAVEVQKAFAQATFSQSQDDIDRANLLADQYQAEMQHFDAQSARKAKSFIGKQKALHLKATKAFAHISPSMKAHAQHEERQIKIQKLQAELMHLQGQYQTPEIQNRLIAVDGALKSLAKKEKLYLKRGVIAATIATIVIGIFTFGAGGAVVQGAFQALKQGAVSIAKSLLIGAIGKAVKGGAKKSDTDKAYEVTNDLEKYPPDRNLNSLDAMIADSQTKKMVAQEKTAWMVPAGLLTLLSMFY